MAHGRTTAGHVRRATRKIGSTLTRVTGGGKWIKLTDGGGQHPVPRPGESRRSPRQLPPFLGDQRSPFQVTANVAVADRWCLNVVQGIDGRHMRRNLATFCTNRFRVAHR